MIFVLSLASRVLNVNNVLFMVRVKIQ